MLAALLEIIFSALFEIVIQAIFEILTELGLRSLERASQSGTARLISEIVLYSIVGLVLGFLSTYLIPVHVIDNPAVRTGLRILSPISMGFLLCLTSWFIYRKDRHEPFWSSRKFIAGAMFGAAYSVSRGLFVETM